MFYDFDVELLAKFTTKTETITKKVVQVVGRALIMRSFLLGWQNEGL